MLTSMNKGCDKMIPMSLRETLQQDLVTAMKAGDDVKKTTLRAVMTAIKTAETSGNADDLDDAAIQKLIATEVKQRTEAFEIYEEAGEADRAGVEAAEREVLQAYLPEQLSSDELEALVTAVITEGGYESKKDMGTAIKEVMARAEGRADGKAISAIVGRSLS